MTTPQSTPQRAGFEEVDILWISEGLSCDGDTISVTAATVSSRGDFTPRLSLNRA